MREFDLASGPHLPAPRSVQAVMGQVLVALVPGIVVHVGFFGPGLLVQIVLASGFALGLEAAMLRLRKRPMKPFLTDYSAVVTAVLFALCIPPLAPWWIAAVAMVFAIVIAKHLYGGLGHNIFNPAMVGYVAVLISFPLDMTQWLLPRHLAEWTPGLLPSIEAILTGRLVVPTMIGGMDAVTGATALDTLKNGLDTGLTVREIRQEAVFGPTGSAGWAWVALAYGVGGLYLLWRRIITWHVPVATLGVAIALTLPLWMLDPAAHASPVQHLAAGGFILAAFFIATDPVSGCTSNRGRLVFGLGVAVITLVIRRWGGYPDGIAFAVLLMNMAAPLIDRYTRPRIYGQ
jgi:electron transport complex protein RnfD